MAYKWEMGTISPGPAAYSAVDTNIYKNRKPAVSFGIVLTRRENNEMQRLTTAMNDKRDITRVVECAKTCRRKFTFGVKHSPKCLPYVVLADNSL